MSETSPKAAYDVAVVGAGPAGSACATMLGRAGFRVLLLDKAIFPRHKICGETVNPRCWSSFDTLGVADEIERRIASPIAAVSVTTRTGREARVDFGSGPRRPFFSMGRVVLDQILVGAATRAGVEFYDGTAVVSLAWHGCWRIEVRDRRRPEKAEFTAGHLIGADGRNSIVAGIVTRMKEGPRRAKRRTAGDERVGVQWHTNLNPRIAGALQMYLFDTGYCGLVSVDGRHTNVSMVTAPEAAAAAKVDFGGFLNRTVWSNPVAASRFPDLGPTGEISTTSPINPRSNRLDHPHAALIGDAAQTVEPFTGEGIRCALEDGISTARHLIEKRQGIESSAATNVDRFRVNRVFSPILRRPPVRDALVTLGSRFPALSRWVVGMVVPAARP